MKKINMKKLGFDLMRLPLEETGNHGSVNQELSAQMIDCFLEKGFTYFDTAYVYHAGLSETTAKKALVERYPRGRFTLADKLPIWLIKETEDCQKYFNEQLERCGVDYFDYYLLHGLGGKSYEDALRYGGFEFMQTIKAEGKVRHIGFSFHDKASLLDRILTEHPEMEFVQLQINYIDWDNEGIQSRKCYETAVKYKKPVIVMEPVKGGTLAAIPEKAEKLLKEHNPGMSVPSWAIRYAASLEGVVMVLSGMSNLEQIKDNTGYMQDFKPLSEEEQAILEQAVKYIEESIAIPCTTCRYCVDTCPRDIPIPDYFGLYNNKKQSVEQAFYVQDLYYKRRSEGHGKASECIECGECEKHCPQHLTIPQFLKIVAERSKQVNQH
jgi:predicted aldo/keto reductase-like oxidoreductase